MLKLVSQERFGATVRKRYDEARPPYERVLAAQEVSQTVKDQLQTLYLTLNPVQLRRPIDRILINLWDTAAR